MTLIPLGMPRLAGRHAEPGLGRPSDSRLIDSFGRVARDLRVSLTDRCNLRCSYCMPEDGLDWMPKSSQLSDEEVIRVISIAVRLLGIREVRFTGGEPLLRRGLDWIVRQTSEMDPRPDISLTTNGIGLSRRADSLAASGLDRLNVSLDTLRRERFTKLTRRDRLRDVLAGLAAASAAHIAPIKINAVLLRGVNDDEAPELLRFALENDYELRFIEQMPLDAQHGWDRKQMIGAEEILEKLSTEFQLSPDRVPRGSAPSELWQVNGGPKRVGVIGSVTRPFCGACDRTRLTADGQIRSCLFSSTESDIRVLIRDRATDEEIAQRWRDAMWEKMAGHGINDPNFLQPRRPMSAIGG